MSPFDINSVVLFLFFFSIDSSEARKQYDEYCLSIMQTITYPHDRTHLQGARWIVPFDLREWKNCRSRKKIKILYMQHIASQWGL
jgi:hypothetical protein